jgi:hypothetical protein
MVHGGNSELVDAILTPVNGEGYLGVNYVKNVGYLLQIEKYAKTASAEPRCLPPDRRP